MEIYKGEKDLSSPITDRTIFVVSCGRCSCSHTDSLTIREHGRTDWSLFFCENGKVYFDETYISPGELWIYPPKVPHKYIICKKDQSAYRFLHFTGSDINGLFSSLNIPIMKPLKANKTIRTEIFDNIRRELWVSNAISQLNCEYYTLKLISLLAQKSTERSNIGFINNVTDTMKHSFFEPYDAEKYAKMIHTSTSRFNHIFKEHIGIPPKAYYNKLRIENACQLLEHTQLTITEISIRSGYENPLYFSQIFKKATMLSPANYRKLHSIKNNNS